MEIKRKARGGARPGAGRKPLVPDRATREQKGTLEAAARVHTEAMLGVLVAVALTGESDSARVSAANAILDRGYGKPRQGIELAGEGGNPIEIDVTVTTADRARALASFIAKTKVEK